MKARVWFLLVVASAVLIGGCETSPIYAERQSELISAAYGAVDSLVSGQPKIQTITPGTNKKVLVATVVELNNLNRSSPFGRLLAEQMSSRLVQMGVTVTELKLRGSLFVSQSQGELMLSRELKDISASQDVDAVLVGTYVDAGPAVYVTVKLVRASDSTVTGAYNFALAKNSAIAALLRN